MKKLFTVNLQPDFYILCDFFSFKPEEVVQYYLNHVALSLFVDVSLDNPFGAATYFFIEYSDVNEQA